MTRFWNFAEKTDKRRLDINGVIAEESWFDDDVTPKMFRDELENGSGDIEVYINSPGGDVFAASQIYTMLREYKGNVTVKIDGLAASAASVIAMAGDSVQMAATAMMMIHDPSTLAAGNAEDMKKAIEMLEEVKESIINAYETKTGLQRAHISRLMSEETWMNARKALELGFIDEILGEGTTDSVLFSSKTSAETVARNIAAKIHEKSKKANPAEGTPAAEKNIDDLLKELNRRKH